MVGRLATVTLMIVFVGSVLCATVCPGESHAANHVCTEADHSCCPKSQENGNTDQCVDTHFVAASKYHHADLSLMAFSFDSVAMILPIDSILHRSDRQERLLIPSEDLLTRHHLLRI